MARDLDREPRNLREAGSHTPDRALRSLLSKASPTAPVDSSGNPRAAIIYCRCRLPVVSPTPDPARNCRVSGAAGTPDTLQRCCGELLPRRVFGAFPLRCESIQELGELAQSSLR